MRISELCIKRPVFASVLSLMIMLVGLVSFSRLSVREYPQIDEPVVSVSTSYTGASAEVIESQITKPLEDALSGIEGVSVMTSTSRAERSNISIRFDLKRSPDSAAADVRDKVSRARRLLPDGVDEPVIAKVEADSQPVLFIALSNEVMSTVEASDYVNRYIKPRLSVLPGAAEVRVFGERLPVMRIDIDKEKLAAYELSTQDIETAVRKQNVEIPAGRIESTAREFTVVASTDLQTVAEFQDIVVAYRQGAAIRIKDIATVHVGPVNERSFSRFMGKPALTIGLVKQATANPLDLSQATQQEIIKINETLPSGMTLVLAYDSSVFIDESINAVYHTIIEAIVLVVLVILFFLRDLRASLIPIVTIPVSLIGAAGIMYAFGFSINTLTLLAMVLAIGLVVDDAIVVLENIFRHIEEGMPRTEAALQGAKEIGFAVVAMTLTLVTVYAPLAFATGRTGRLFIEFALALAGAVLVSGFVALTLTPMMCSVLLRHQPKHGRLYMWVESILSRLNAWYEYTLSLALRYRGWVLGFGCALGLAIIPLSMIIKSELAPVEDRGVVIGRITSPQGATVGYTSRQMEAIEKLYDQLPEMATYQSNAGFPTVVDGMAILRLKPWDERKRSQQEIVKELQPKMAAIPGVQAFPTSPASLGQSSRSTPIEFILMSQLPYAELGTYVDKFVDDIKQQPYLQNVQTDLRLDTPEIRVQVDRDKLAHLGVDVDTLGKTLETLLGGRKVTRYKDQGEQYDVYIQVQAGDKRSPSDIESIFVRTREGGMVPLSSLVTVQESVSPQSLNHFNRLRAVTIRATLAPGYSLGEALNMMETVAKQSLPKNVFIDLDGQSREYKESSSGIYTVFLMAIAFIYLVLAAQFESWRNPLIIMISVPLSMTGALLVLWLVGGSLSIYSQIGLITLVGLITKHGILIVEFSTQLQHKGYALLDAVTQASVMRLRPILMTTGAMVLGAIPLALASGAGAESRSQIGWVIVGGMCLGTCLTLYVVPCFYSLVAESLNRNTPIKTDI